MDKLGALQTNGLHTIRRRRSQGLTTRGQADFRSEQEAHRSSACLTESRTVAGCKAANYCKHDMCVQHCRLARLGWLEAKEPKEEEEEDGLAQMSPNRPMTQVDRASEQSPSIA